MCHTICPRKVKNPLLESGYFGTFSNFLVGNKQFKFFDWMQELVSPYTYYKFEFESCPEGLVCKEKPQNQEICFHIPLRNRYITKSHTQYKFGIHISPLFNSDGEMRNYSQQEISIRSQINSFHIPVFFYKDSIIFYDGFDVSVYCFYILKPLLLNEWLLSVAPEIGWVELQIKEMVEWYSEIYKHIEKVSLK